MIGGAPSVASRSATNAFEDLRRRITFGELDADDPAAAGFDDVSSYNRVLAPVRSLHENVGLNGCDDLVRRIFVEDYDCVDARQCSEDFTSFRCWIDRTIRRLALRSRRAVAIHANDQEIAKGSGVAKIPGVPGMKDVEYPVGKDNLLSVLAGTLD